MGKLYARVLLVRLQQLAERVYPDSQCTFRAERSTVDMIFSLRQLQEKCREQQKPLFIAFIYLTKVFDLVSQNGLLNILLKIGCGEQFPLPMPSPHPWHQLEGQSVQHSGSCPRQPPYNVHAAQATQTALAWPCAPY